ncbi:hypothetical protein [Cytobacillus sp. FSL R5-0596]|uniref:hypothetical protein n=1 Tax=Cytobacillus sp. FSL R5-0596 TaxID=2954696 RepID=UPI0030FCF1BC
MIIKVRSLQLALFLYSLGPIILFVMGRQPSSFFFSHILASSIGVYYLDFLRLKGNIKIQNIFILIIVMVIFLPFFAIGNIIPEFSPITEMQGSILIFNSVIMLFLFLKLRPKRD